MTNAWILSPDRRASVQIISVSLAEINLGEGPTSHPSLGHDDAYKPLTRYVIQPVCWHDWWRAF